MHGLPMQPWNTNELVSNAYKNIILHLLYHELNYYTHVQANYFFEHILMLLHCHM